MKIMGLIDILKESGKRARGLALAGVLGLSGCLTTPQEAARLIVRPVLTGDFSDWDKPGQMSPQGNNASGGNGNVQNQVSNIRQQNSPRAIFSSFKRWNDLNGNGYVDYPQEFFGETNNFSINENIILYVNMPTIGNGISFAPSLLKMKAQIVDSRTGDLKETQEIDLTKYGYIIGCNCSIVPKNFLNEGSYRVLWSYNVADLPNAPWCYLGSYDFSVNK